MEVATSRPKKGNVEGEGEEAGLVLSVTKGLRSKGGWKEVGGKMRVWIHTH
jgi:hypothetical protein